MERSTALAVACAGVGAGAEEILKQVGRFVAEDGKVQWGVASRRIAGGEARGNVEARRGQEETDEVALPGPHSGGKCADGAFGDGVGGLGRRGGRRAGIEGVGLLVVGREDFRHLQNARKGVISAFFCLLESRGSGCSNIWLQPQRKVKPSV